MPSDHSHCHHHHHHHLLLLLLHDNLHYPQDHHNVHHHQQHLHHLLLFLLHQQHHSHLHQHSHHHLNHHRHQDHHFLDYWDQSLQARAVSPRQWNPGNLCPHSARGDIKNAHHLNQLMPFIAWLSLFGFMAGPLQINTCSWLQLNTPHLQYQRFCLNPMLTSYQATFQ